MRGVRAIINASVDAILTLQVEAEAKRFKIPKSRVVENALRKFFRAWGDQDKPNTRQVGKGS